MYSQLPEAVRRTVRMATRMVQTDGSALGTCLMVEFSGAGARLKLDASDADALPEQFILLLSHNGQLRRHCSVEWRKGNDVSVRFITDCSMIEN